MEEFNQLTEVDREDQFIEERNIKNYFMKLHYIDLYPLNPDRYYEGKKRRAIKNGPKVPTRKDSQKDVGINLWLRIKTLFSEDARKNRDIL